MDRQRGPVKTTRLYDATGRQARARAQRVASLIMGMRPRDEMEMFVCSQIVLLHEMIADAAAGILRGMDSVRKLKAQANVVNLSRAMYRNMTELRRLQARPSVGQLDAAETAPAPAEAAEPAVDAPAVDAPAVDAPPRAVPPTRIRVNISAYLKRGLTAAEAVDAWARENLPGDWHDQEPAEAPVETGAFPEDGSVWALHAGASATAAAPAG